MRYWYDLEFHEDGSTIDLISIGIVSEDDREYYAVNSDMDQSRVREHRWLSLNVWPHLPLRGAKEGLVSVGQGRTEVRLTNLGVLDTDSTAVKPKWVIANEVREFTSACGEDEDRPAELWSWFGAYDHVALMQLWGPMIRRPKHLPMYTRDIQQEADRLGIAHELPRNEGIEHNALADARHRKAMWEFVADYERSLLR